ncbi:MAG: hypothetical protein M1817_000841 [Caeruleum heppii]|nr:MAG: hypothetical protein M1817_000841 [Caeruleum heppii]
MTSLRRFVLSFFAIFSTILRGPAAAYDSNPRVPDDLQENFNPALADQDFAISCVGSKWPWWIPRFPDWDPNTLTVQELCAKPQYGGRGPGKHLGGWCHDNTFEDIGFDFLRGNPGVQKAELLANPRAELFCRSRCFCTTGEFDDYDAERPARFRTGRRQAHDTYRISLDINDDFHPGTSHTPQSSESVAALHYVSARQAVKEWYLEEHEQWKDPLAHDTWVSLDKENEITCGGDFPDWPAPPPFEWSHWDSLQQLCAVQLSGGDYQANAGGHCYRFHANGNGHKLVYFTDEMTPRYDWTWQNFRVAISIRSYCRTHCRCSNPDKEIRSTHLWQYQGEGTNTELIIPPYSKGGARTPRAVGTCGSDGKRFCFEPWPSDRLGPTPAATPYFPSPSSSEATAVAPSNIKASTGQCAVPDASGVKSQCGCSGCNSVSECSWSEFGACRCVARTVQKQGSGRDRFLGVCSQILSGPLGKIRKRDAEGGIDTSIQQATVDGDDGTMAFLDPETQERLACPCNVSYVSFACCDSRDGVVYEPPGLKLGSLS